ncbi:MAG TPA: HEAT repeat domain-containing protein [Pyrinomonadaceae bacterium]|nr:HEAT repeat domain-containing protein [Pyrinomonadaceae bacterium]
MATASTNGSNGRPGAREAGDATRSVPTMTPQGGPAAAQGRRRTPWPLVVVAVLFVVVPFLSWYWTTFLRPLDDEKITEYLNDREKPRHVQHALEQIDKKIVAGDAGARKWYPQIVNVASSPVADLRMAAAWVMGDDNREPEFRAALLRLLEDPEPAVRRMAALSLSRFRDSRARPELLSMLRPHVFKSPIGGTLLSALTAGSRVNRESLVARVREPSGDVREVRAPLAGEIERVLVAAGANLHAGEELLVLAPDAENILQSLRALALVGNARDADAILPYVRGADGMPGEVQRQAQLTLEIVEKRVVEE